MEKGLAYKVECFYDNDNFYDNYCVRDSNDKMRIISEGELYNILNTIRRDYSLYKFINKIVKVSDVS